ncbi:hypothetical protein Fcan01_11428 [Folsomia candida]|uniref:Uncharacterized protein n=1 Tax=Folsomia candida TaxID=158441 RepID=A0A226EBK7_FOLCA|nr:hypothetical protein Fcan01_11428 [Folsomia candida]
MSDSELHPSKRVKPYSKLATETDTNPYTATDTESDSETIPELVLEKRKPSETVSTSSASSSKTSLQTKGKPLFPSVKDPAPPERSHKRPSLLASTFKTLREWIFDPNQVPPQGGTGPSASFPPSHQLTLVRQERPLTSSHPSTRDFDPSSSTDTLDSNRSKRKVDSDPFSLPIRKPRRRLTLGPQKPSAPPEWDIPPPYSTLPARLTFPETLIHRLNLQIPNFPLLEPFEFKAERTSPPRRPRLLSIAEEDLFHPNEEFDTETVAGPTPLFPFCPAIPFEVIEIPPDLDGSPSTAPPLLLKKELEKDSNPFSTPRSLEDRASTNRGRQLAFNVLPPLAWLSLLLSSLVTPHSTTEVLDVKQISTKGLLPFLDLQEVGLERFSKNFGVLLPKLFQNKSGTTFTKNQVEGTNPYQGNKIRSPHSTWLFKIQGAVTTEIINSTSEFIKSTPTPTSPNSVPTSNGTSTPTPSYTPSNCFSNQSQS